MARLRFALALLLLAFPGAAMAACALPPQAAAAGKALLVEANATRAALGLGALTWDGRLAAAARAKACALAAGGEFGHSGAEIRRRAKVAGCSFRGPLAENLAWGYRSAHVAVQEWLESPGHRRNLLHRRVRSAGAAWMPRASGGGYWVMMYAGSC